MSIIQFDFFHLVFFSTLSREIIKDLEDKEGDKLMNSENIASEYFKLSVPSSSILLIIVLIPLLCILVSLVDEFIYYYSAKSFFYLSIVHIYAFWFLVEMYLDISFLNGFRELSYLLSIIESYSSSIFLLMLL